MKTLFSLLISLCAMASLAPARPQPAPSPTPAIPNARAVMHTNGVVVSPTNFWANAPTNFWAYKTASQTNGTTNFVSDTALTFTAEANTTYLVSGAIGFVSILVSTNQQTGMDGKFLVPTNATVFGNPPYYLGALTGNFLGLSYSYTSSFTLVEEHDGAAYLPFQFILATGTNSGAVTFQFKPSGANTHAVVGAGSYLRAEVVKVP